jgi:hypothetical protein
MRDNIIDNFDFIWFYFLKTFVKKSFVIGKKPYGKGLFKVYRINKACPLGFCRIGNACQLGFTESAPHAEQPIQYGELVD